MGSDLLPEQRRFVGIMSFVVGILCLGMAGMVVGLITSSRAEAASRFTEQQESCKARLSLLGGEVSDIPGRIIWSKRGIQEAPARLGEASAAAVLCPGWKLATACVGSQCPESDAMRIVLEPITPEE